MPFCERIIVAVKVTVRFLGVFHTLSGTGRLDMEFEKPVTIGDVIRRLVEIFTPEFKRGLIDSELDDPRPNAIILLNKKEIGVLNGLQTEVTDGNEIVLIPVSHGG